MADNEMFTAQVTANPVPAKVPQMTKRPPGLLRDSQVT